LPGLEIDDSLLGGGVAEWRFAADRAAVLDGGAVPDAVPLTKWCRTARRRSAAALARCRRCSFLEAVPQCRVALHHRTVLRCRPCRDAGRRHAAGCGAACQVVPHRRAAFAADRDALPTVLVPRRNAAVPSGATPPGGAPLSAVPCRRAQPRVVAITQVTELGTCYSLEELSELSAFCRSHGLVCIWTVPVVGAVLRCRVALRRLAALSCRPCCVADSAYC